MQTDRRGFFRLAAAAGAAGSGLFSVVKRTLAMRGRFLQTAPATRRRGFRHRAVSRQPDARGDAQRFAQAASAAKASPESRRPPRSVVRGNYIEPYTTMYDTEDKLFKMWARAGSDWKSRRLDGNAAYMLYFTSTDGVHWDKPDLGLMPIAGRRDHNIIFTSDLVAANEAASPLRHAALRRAHAAHDAAGKEGLLLGGEQEPAPPRRRREVRRPGDRAGSPPRSPHRHLARRHPLVVRERPLLADAERRLRTKGTTA